MSPLRSRSEMFQYLGARLVSFRSRFRTKRERRPLMVEALEDRCLLDGTWAMLAPMPTARAQMAAGAANGILYVVGGGNGPILATNEAYDPVSNTWATKAPMPTARGQLGVGIVNGVLYAVGGASVPGVPSSAVQAYDPATNTWATTAPMPTPTIWPAIAVANRILYAAGGDSGGYSATLAAYTPATNTWTTNNLPPMPTPRSAAATGVVNGVIYVVGGQTTGGIIVGTLEAYDPATNMWMAKASMPTPRVGLSAGVVNGILYAMGGINTITGVVPTLESYNPLTDTWTTEPDMPTARTELAAGVVNNVLYAVGGRNDNNFTTNEAFTPTTLTATGSALSATAGQRFAAVVASFTDSGPNPGAATDYSAVINWGDGSRISTGGISDNGSGNYDIAASHTYADPRTYTATITITDNRDTTRQATATSTIEVTSPSSPSHGSKPAVFAEVVAALQPVAAEPANIHRPDAAKLAILARPLPSLVREDVSEIRSMRASVAMFATETSGILARQVRSTAAVFDDPLNEWQPVDQINSATVDLLAESLLAG